MPVWIDTSKHSLLGHQVLEKASMAYAFHSERVLVIANTQDWLKYPNSNGMGRSNQIINQSKSNLDPVHPLYMI